MKRKVEGKTIRHSSQSHQGSARENAFQRERAQDLRRVTPVPGLLLQRQREFSRRTTARAAAPAFRYAPAGSAPVNIAANKAGAIAVNAHMTQEGITHRFEAFETIAIPRDGGAGK
jgi:hypothetical protein